MHHQRKRRRSGWVFLFDLKDISRARELYAAFSSMSAIRVFSRTLAASARVLGQLGTEFFMPLRCCAAAINFICCCCRTSLRAREIHCARYLYILLLLSLSFSFFFKLGLYLNTCSGKQAEIWEELEDRCNGSQDSATAVLMEKCQGHWCLWPLDSWNNRPGWVHGSCAGSCPWCWCCCSMLLGPRTSAAASIPRISSSSS